MRSKCGSGLVWERACSRRRCISQSILRLTLRIREQARSHIGSLLRQIFSWRRRDSCPAAWPHTSPHPRGRTGCPTSSPLRSG
ncbi:hypothetical protein DBR46_11335 [Pseudomonas sp. KBW05]|nr:hypothetical protein DBR46_11335 [Pseudomonas sp. KBW05]